MNIIDGDGNNNTLVGTAGDDLINGYDGDDTINAGDGNDWIDGGSGDDTIDAGDGDDTVIYDANDTSVTGGAGNDVLVFSNGDVYSFDTSLLAGMGFEFAGDRYTDGTDDVIDILDANFLYLEERRYHADGTYTRTVFDALNVETWSEWIRVYDASGVLVSENFVQDGTGGGGGSNTAPEDYASVTEDLVLIVTGNLFDDDLVNNPTGIYELTEIAGVVIPTGTVQPGAPVIISGTFGTLHIWSDGEYEYYLNNSQVQSLSTDDIVPDSFAYEFTEDGQTLNTDFIVEIVGTNDAPVATNNTAYVQKDIVLSDTGNVITDDDGSGVDSDIDNLQLGITEVNGNALNPGSATLIAGLYGDLLIDGNTGDYTYTLATSGPGFITVQALDFGETLIDAFTYTLSDGSEFVLANLDITVEGSSVSVQAFGDVNTTTEDEVTPVTGSVLANDAGIGLFVSNVNSTSVASSGDTIVVGAYGTLTIDATGAYSYVVDPASAPAQALKDGESLTDVFTYTAENGFNSENANLSISITGVNDAAVVSGDDTAQVTEDLGNPPTDLGVISVFDADTGESTFQAGDYVGVYGTVALTGAGAYTYTLDNSSLLVQSLGEGIIATDTVAIQTFDGTTHNIVVDITGVNDAATFSGDDQGSVTEEDDPLTLIDSGILIVSDVDTGEAVFNASTQPGAYGSFTIDAAGNWTYSADNTQTAIQELGGSSTLTETFTVSSIDNTTHNITVTINGTNDAAVIGGTDTGSVTEEDDPTTLTATGLLTITDIDLNEAIFSANTIAGTYGSLTIDTAGNWSYTADNTQSAIQSLGLGSSLVDTITIQGIDGTTHDIAITINGTNDAAVIAGDDQGSVTEDATTPTIT
ncbi:MAG: VCBS domain-containing protein, partial [Anderseniella sp.]